MVSCLVCAIRWMTCVGVLLLTPTFAGAQSAEEADAPRTAWGEPNLQGVWDFRTITPLQRPARLAEREVLSDEEVAALEAAVARTRVDRPRQPGSVGGYNQFWWDFGSTVVKGRRTSLIVNPPNGRIPPLTEAAHNQIGSLAADVPGRRPVRYRTGGIGAAGPEDRGLAERCLVGLNSGPPMVLSGYNNNMQLFQTPDYVVILNEMVHDARIVPLDGRPHLPADLRQWMGDSRGHWEGDTLVIESTNFTDKTSSFSPNALSGMGTGDTLHLTERLRRLDDDTLLYQFTVDDPVTFTRPFTAEISMQRSKAFIFEYACHEGNYGMTNLLSGGRAQEDTKP